MNRTRPGVTSASWSALQRLTDARIALGRCGNSVPSAAHLAFQWDQARARDAVHLPLDVLGLALALREQGQNPLLLHSAAVDRAHYLRRPDLGRSLDSASRQLVLDGRAQAADTGAFDVAFVVADGLSALAIHSSALDLMACIVERLRADPAQTWSVAPISLVEQARVAVGDEVGAGLNANAVVVLIGERPGLSAPDSLGLYITWGPRVGTSDAQRNCISNVRSAGLSVAAATDKLFQILTQSRARGLTGVALKDEVDDASSLASAGVREGARRLSFGP